jgi:hypothetical protein
MANTGATSGYPGDGDILWNNATQTSATQLNISHLTDDGTDIDIFLALLSVGEQIIIQSQTASADYQTWTISGTPTNVNPGAANSYWTFPVTFNASGGVGTTGFANGAALFLALVNGVSGPTGPAGPTGPTGAASTVAGPTGPTGAASSVAGPTGPTGNAAVASYTRTSFTATAGQTTFTVSYTVGYVQVYLNGVFLNGSDYTATNGTSIVLATAAGLNDIVEVVAINVNTFGQGPVGPTGTAGATGPTGPAYTIFQAVQTASFTAVAGNGYPVNTTSGAITVTLPASPSAGNIVQITDYAGTFGTNYCTINPNGGKVNGIAANAYLSTSRASVSLIYVDSTQGWLGYWSFNQSSISQISTYLIVAGGGGASQGGGGAGGLLAGTIGLNTGTTYTVVVGGGGPGGAGSGTTGTSGGTSSITTLTAAVGGGGGGGGANGVAGGSGGGGGAGGGISRTGGAGTSGQGFAGGGNGSFAGSQPAGGGGGAGAVGGTATSTTVAGAGGIGLSSSITGSALDYAGGGGGGVYATGGTAGAGGSGGGGAGSSNTANGTAGTVNTGGGGGGTGNNYTGGAGGSGVVILSVPTAVYTGTVTGSPTVTTSGSFTIIKFTASGSYTA